MPNTAKEAKFLLRCLAGEPDISKRQLAPELGISLGKLNYCLQSFRQGLGEGRKFSHSNNKKGNAYLLTPAVWRPRPAHVAFLKYKSRSTIN